MTEVSYDEIYQRKIVRQDRIQELEMHAMGAVPHIGQISPGCNGCLLPDENASVGVFAGRQCQYNCPFCYYDFSIADETSQQLDTKMQEYITSFRKHIPQYVSFVSDGETLLYLDKLKKVAIALNALEEEHNVKIYRHLYTNGILATEDVLDYIQFLGVDELRFHVSASNFDPVVIQNMRIAKQKGFIITVEEPGWPPNRDPIMEHLPVFEEIGIKHLNIIEMWLTGDNFDRVSAIYPGGFYYKDYLYHLYDEGMVYDIMEERIKKGYTFSVLDCNSAIEKYREYQEPAAEHIFNIDTLKGMSAPFERHWWEND